MKPAIGQRRFRMETRYIHQRSEGMTNRRNGGSRYQLSTAGLTAQDRAEAGNKPPSGDRSGGHN